MKNKTCTKCGKVKPVAEFHKMTSSPDGYKPRCKECRNDSGKSYYSGNSEKINEKQRQYYSDNIEVCRARIKNYGDLHKEEASNRSRKSYENNKKIVLIRNRETSKARCKTDPVYRLRLRLSGQIRQALTSSSTYTSRSRMHRITGLIGIDLVNYLWSTFEEEYGIPRSLVDLKDIEVDHIIPKSQGATLEGVEKLNHHTNLRLLFKEDNAKKHARILTKGE